MQPLTHAPGNFVKIFRFMKSSYRLSLLAFWLYSLKTLTNVVLGIILVTHKQNVKTQMGLTNASVVKAGLEMVQLVQVMRRSIFNPLLRPFCINFSVCRL